MAWKNSVLRLAPGLSRGRGPCGGQSDPGLGWGREPLGAGKSRARSRWASESLGLSLGRGSCKPAGASVEIRPRTAQAGHAQTTPQGQYNSDPRAASAIRPPSNSTIVNSIPPNGHSTANSITEAGGNGHNHSPCTI